MKKAIPALLLCCCLSFSSCLGPNHLFNKINNWNGEATTQNWLNELIFIGMVVIPVYEFALLGDYLIINTVDYWGGENWITDPGTFPAAFSNK